MIGLRCVLVSGAIGALTVAHSLIATATGPAQAQTAVKPAATTAELTKNYFDQCMKDWDASTHMTRSEWNRVCQRVASDRVKFKIQQDKTDKATPSAKPN